MERNYFTDKLSQTKIKSLDTSLNTYYCGDKVAYKMYVGGKLLFKGTDYKPATMRDWDSLDANLDLLSFLCIGIGAIDAEYFKDYTPAQLEWAKDSQVKEDLNLYINDIQYVDFDDEDLTDNYNQAIKQFKHKTF